MKTLVVYITFEDIQETSVELERKQMMESLWDSDIPMWVGHEYRKATKTETREFTNILPGEG